MALGTMQLDMGEGYLFPTIRVTNVSYSANTEVQVDFTSAISAELANHPGYSFVNLIPGGGYASGTSLICVRKLLTDNYKLGVTSNSGSGSGSGASIFAIAVLKKD